jgi:hypothetical protein
MKKVLKAIILFLFPTLVSAQGLDLAKPLLQLGLTSAQEITCHRSENKNQGHFKVECRIITEHKVIRIPDTKICNSEKIASQIYNAIPVRGSFVKCPLEWNHTRELGLVCSDDVHASDISINIGVTYRP